MTSSDEPTAPRPDGPGTADADAVIDVDAAAIDARSPDVAEEIAALEDEAAELGLPTPDPSQVPPPDTDRD